jgi:hypothetical protein
MGKADVCEIETCLDPSPILRTVSLSAWYGEDAPVRRVCSFHFDQWALAVRERAVPQWVAMMSPKL